MWKIEGNLENRDGVLYVGNFNSVELAENYGTPLYVIDGDRVEKNYKRIRDAFAKRYEKFKIFYAIKANSNLAVLRILQRQGAGTDCSCPAEIELAKKAGFSDILYTGNYNSDEELRHGLNSGAIINLDDISLFKRMKSLGKPSVICFRVNPGVGAGKFKQIVLGGQESKFGMSEKGVLETYRLAKKSGIERFGIHMMAGSCILDPDYFEQITDILLDIGGSISEELGIKFEFINIGGGFGIPYQPGEKELDVEETAEKVVSVFKEKMEEYNYGEPFLYIEPGRYIVGDSTILLSKVTATKQAYKKYVGVDAGMNTLIRPALYGAYHQIYVANKLNQEEKEYVNVCGPICENTDMFAEDRELPIIEIDDTIAFLDAGAYCFSMSSEYGSRPKPAEVLIKDGEVHIVRERGTFEDMIAKQKIPEGLK